MAVVEPHRRLEAVAMELVQRLLGQHFVDPDDARALGAEAGGYLRIVQLRIDRGSAARLRRATIDDTVVSRREKARLSCREGDKRTIADHGKDRLVGGDGALEITRQQSEGQEVAQLLEVVAELGAAGFAKADMSACRTGDLGEFLVEPARGAAEHQ